MVNCPKVNRKNLNCLKPSYQQKKEPVFREVWNKSGDVVFEAGCHVFGARYYDPVLGRWHSQDPMDQYASPYNAMGNNPVNLIDRWGMCAGSPENGGGGGGGYSGVPSWFGDGGSYGSNWVQDWSAYDVVSNTFSLSESFSNVMQMVKFAQNQAAKYGGNNNVKFNFNQGEFTGAWHWEQTLVDIKAKGEMSWENGEKIGEIAGAGTGLAKVYDDAGFTTPYISGGMENTAQALSHYFNGHGTPVTLGNNTINTVLNSKGFQYRHNRITSGKTRDLNGNFPINLTSNVLHVGLTNVDYSINCTSDNCTVTYNLFVRDGFWDVDFIDEKITGKLGLTFCIPDGSGPNLERFGGTPYQYNPITVTSTFPNPGY